MEQAATTCVSPVASKTQTQPAQKRSRSTSTEPLSAKAARFHKQQVSPTDFSAKRSNEPEKRHHLPSVQALLSNSPPHVSVSQNDIDGDAESPPVKAPSLSFSTSDSSASSSTFANLGQRLSTPSSVYGLPLEPLAIERSGRLKSSWASLSFDASTDALRSPAPMYPSPEASPIGRQHSMTLPVPLTGGSSGSSYRGSIDESMLTDMLTSPMTGLAFDASQLAFMNHQHQPHPFLLPSPVPIHRETRKGKDLGLSLEDFEVLETLGTGTFGRVLLVRLLQPASPNLPHYFAMKVLSKAEIVRLKQVQHINSERTLLASVRHSGVVNLFCTFQDERNLYILMEFIQGGELFSHLRRAGRFSPDVARFYAANILMALEHLHDRDIIYRDLKPENLLLDHQGYIKMTDFGFAKYVPDRTFTLCGTPEYLAPEIIQSTGHGKAADYWAFGVLLFEMMCGYPAFWADNPLAIYEKILAGRLYFPDHVGPVARDLIKRLLSANLSRRLGNLKNGIRDIMTHSFFAGVDWDTVRRRQVVAPIVPRARSPSDCSHFEKYAPVNLDTLPAVARAYIKRQKTAQGIWREPSEAEKERMRRAQELEDQYASYFTDF